VTLTIVSDQEGATAVLREIATLCRAHGAEWHPQLTAEVREGAMRLLAPPGTEGSLITVPLPLLMPIEGARWGEGESALELLEAPAAATALQRELLQLMVALYNATDKMGWWRERHPARLAERCPAVAAALAVLKPGPDNERRPPARCFLATRSLECKPDPPPGAPQPMLMPLVDLLNHHHNGSRYRTHGRALRIAVAQAGGDECFTHYGHRRDGLDLALHYGHSDRSTPFAHSAPLEIVVAGVGRIVVERQVWGIPAHPLDPPRVALESEGVRLSHLCCHRDHPERVRMLLLLALQGGLKRRGHDQERARRLARQGLEAIAAANIRLLEQLISAAEASDHPGGAILAAAARHQGAILQKVLG
jgi:hypothetical protein